MKPSDQAIGLAGELCFMDVEHIGTPASIFFPY
jgi:hypothetical protein